MMKHLPILLAFVFCSPPALSLDIAENSSTDSHTFTIELMFKVGSAHDPKSKYGLADFAANIVSTASQKYSNEQLSQLFYPMASNVDASVDKDVTIFSATVHKDHRQQFYEIFRDLILHPRFAQDDFDRQKKATLSYVQESLRFNDDEELSKIVLERALFGENHPYSHCVVGTEQGLQNISLQDVKDHYARYFTKDRLVIGLAGNYDESFKAQVLADMQGLPGAEKTEESPLPAVSAPKGLEITLVDKPNTFGSAVFMGFPWAIDRRHQDYAALMIANSYFGEHRMPNHGRLFKRMREIRGLNYGDYSYLEWFPSGGRSLQPRFGTPRRQNYFGLWIRPVQIAKQFKDNPELKDTSEGNTLFAIRLALFELKKLITDGITADDFDRMRGFVKGNLQRYVETQSARLGYRMDGKLYGREDYVSEIVSQLDKTTLEDVNKAIKKHLQVQNFQIAVVTDSSEIASLVASLKTNQATPIIYKPEVRKGLPKEILDEDKIIEALPLSVSTVEILRADGLFKE